MKYAVRSGLSLAIATSCSPGAPQPDIPQGWTTTKIPECCTIALPPKAAISVGKDPIDDPVYLLTGPGFSGTLSLTSRGGGVPLPGSGDEYRRADLEIDGLPAVTASYRVSDPEYPDRRNLVWTYRGVNDGTGKSLLLELSCKDATCAAFDPLVRSLRRQVPPTR